MNRPGPLSRHGPWSVLIALLLVFGLTPPVYGQDGVNLLRDGGFESLPPGAAWNPVPGDFSAEFDKTAPYEGETSLRLDRAATTSSPFAAAAQAIDATPYRGRTIRFRAAARVTPGGQSGRVRAGLWLRVDREGGAQGFFDNMSDRPITDPEWQVYEVTGPVADDASTIITGLLLSGVGSAWIDAASLAIVPDLPPAQVSTERPSVEGLGNLEAFARLYGYVRWFSAASDPSDPRWTVIAVEGARDAEAARDPADLAERLRRWFQPMAPGLVLDIAPLTPAPPPAGHDALVRWRHTGVAFGNPAYRSERIPSSRAEIWQAALGGGLAVSLPVTGRVTRDGVVPAHDDSRALSSTSPEDRAVRIGGLVIAWNVFRHFYPYFDDDGAAWDASLQDGLAAAAAAPGRSAYLEVLERMVARLDDGHGEVGPQPAAYRLPFVWQPVQEALVITGLPTTTPAGLQVGDVVLDIDGEPVGEGLAREQERVSASTDHRRVWRAASRLMSRETDRPVDLLIQRGEDPPIHVSVRPAPFAAMSGVLAEPRPAPVTWLPAGAWYFDLTRIDDARLTEALAMVQPDQAVIFDMRGYPGGVNAAFLGHLSGSPISTPPFRIPVDVLPEARARTWEQVGWSVSPKTPRFTGPVAFLTDARAISYAETLLAMVAGNGLGEIVGSPTAGTNGNINPFSVPGGYVIRWTGMKVVNHDGSPLHGHGIIPTIPASRTIAGIRAGRDEVLERALERVAHRTP